MNGCIKLIVSALCVLFVWGAVADEAAQPDWLSAGRRMVSVPLPGGAQELSGRAPEGEGEPFRVMSGSEVLWEGGAGAEFCVKMPRGARKVYLMSMGARNLNWSGLAWKCGEKERSAKGPMFFKKVNEYNVKDVGILPGKQDAGPALRSLLSKVRSASMESTKNGVRIRRARIVFPKGTYHFYPQGALPMSFYVSNHDQQDVTPVGIPLVDLRGVELEGNGSTFVFHGKMQPFLLMHCMNMSVKNITIAYDAPYFVEGEVTEIAGGKTTLKFGTPFRWKVEGGRFRILREDGEEGVNMALAFEKNGPMVPKAGNGDMGWSGQKVEQPEPNAVRFNVDASRQGVNVGHVLVLRHGARPHPAMMLYSAFCTALENVVFRDSQGMALLAQRSKMITINGGGCIAGKGRVYTVSADATHFSNCGGEIKTENALYEGMMDDAINVHSTCLSIERIENATEIIAKYMHHQSIGFEVFRPGEKMQFIKGKTLENHPDIGVAKSVEKLDERHLRIRLESPLPEGIGVGDAVENADWYPAVTFKNNTVRYNRARGCLFTTPKPVVVEGNKFVRSHGSAILLAGDAQGWYESGRCLDVSIRNNLFDHNLTAHYQFTEAVISIYPEVRELGRQRERYHRHIIIEGNTFRTHRVPLLYAQSAEDIVWRNNTVKYDDLFHPRRNGEPFIFRDPKPTQLSIPLKP